MEYENDKVVTNEVANEIVELEEVVSFVSGTITGNYGSGGWSVGGSLTANC